MKEFILQIRCKVHNSEVCIDTASVTVIDDYARNGYSVETDVMWCVKRESGPDPVEAIDCRSSWRAYMTWPRPLDDEDENEDE